MSSEGSGSDTVRLLMDSGAQTETGTERHMQTSLKRGRCLTDRGRANVAKLPQTMECPMCEYEGEDIVSLRCHVLKHLDKCVRFLFI